MHIILNILLKIIKVFTFTRRSFALYESGEYIYDNSYYFFQYMESKNKYHNLYCVYSEEQYLQAIKKNIAKSKLICLFSRKNTKLWNIKNLIRTLYFFKKCKYFIISYRYPGDYLIYDVKYILSNKQILINLRHGQFPIKKVDDYYSELCKFNKHDNYFFRVGSKYSYTHYFPESLKKLKCKWFFEEQPRNDFLFVNKEKELCELLNIKSVRDYKIVLCMTTYREGARSFFAGSFPIQLSKADFMTLQDYLSENKIILLIKAHHESPISDDDAFVKNMKNIILKTTDDFENNHLFVNEIFKYTSAMITDYSSALFDYLLLNKPVGYAFSDSKKYIENNGLNIPFDVFVAGNKIHNCDSLISFLKGIFQDDEYKSKRKEICLQFNDSYSGKACDKIFERFFK